MIKKNDIILFGLILLIAISAIFFINMKRSDGSKVLITINGKEYKTLSLNIDKKITIKEDNGDLNIIQIKDGEVDMIDANCPDKICVKHSKIHFDHETIVCLPHKLVVEIINGEESDVDMIAK